jgi:gamma-glutamylputrescine oxidase
MAIRSFWEEESFYAPCDFLVVGAGLAGLWSAFELNKQFPSASITIVERGNLPIGASTRNAGFACFGSPTEMISDAETMGYDAMWRIVELRYQGIEKIRSVLGDAAIDYDDCGGYECFSSIEEMQRVEENLAWINEGMAGITGQSNCFQFTNDKLASFGFAGFTGMVENKKEGGLHSGKLVKSLLQLLASKGINILFSTDIIGYTREGQSIAVATANARLHCKQLVLTTNAFLPQLHVDCGIVPARGQVLVTAPIHGIPMRGTFHFDEGFYYFRNVGDRVLIGGARNKAFTEEQTTELETTALIQNELERFVSTHILPHQSYTIEHRWSGVMAFTKNKLPVLQQLETGVWLLSCCNGMGVALTPVMAEQLVQQITGTFKQPLMASSLHLPTT